MHVPVLFDEVMRALQPRPGGRYLDCTVGNGGHAAGLLERCAPDGLVLGFDADPAAIARVRACIPDERLILHPCWLDEAPTRARQLGFAPVDGVLVDLGLSANQLEDPARGFSFMREGPLDMRFDPTAGISAAEWLDTTDLATLARVLREYGEVPNAMHVAQAIWRARPLRSTSQLRDVVADIIKPRSRRIHPATQVFQALRIAVNDELRRLREALPRLIDLLAEGGRIAVIAFHSLEDRIVKETFRHESMPQAYSPGFGKANASPPRLKLLTRRPIMPSPEEIAVNPRARSARLRVAERIGG
ncbi:MAG: 16S rRNA (cytosine(1402)-N(4))-methyltransferase RsmH [Anaerolineae bacterium]|nr:16S rRNA (cytosine(1402)-N(4))-methyltransferase RsmH [Anaerolineae bacterium]